MPQVASLGLKLRNFLIAELYMNPLGHPVSEQQIRQV
jgi:hypothetical protein